ncbi:divergent AAA domain protein [Oxobacter pfennigii]|uniref:Divergent AAA domain protein n=1 Tax=Oxobacter pfennigii TaxID=36849 RepID=A0A0P8YBR5_9CLOT|nr:RNA-binding domain-containing protein [Oxobacter pfennigii]KPU44532.1 divergent AAA domain protein [Oxobacter pfennigii]
MEIQKLQSLLNKQEGPKLDFKQKLNTNTYGSKKELSKDVCAIANSRGGRGYIIFGIEDKTKNIIGINPSDFNEEKIQQIISTRCEPPIPISVEVVEYKEKSLAVITIYSGDQKPYQIRDVGTFYIRRGSTTDIMRKEELAGMLQEYGLLNYELTQVYKAGIESLDMAKVKDYASRIGVVFDGRDLSILESLGIVAWDKEDNKYNPTSGGLLLFGFNPQLFIPNSGIKIINKINPQFDEVNNFGGDILEMLDCAEEFLKKVVDVENYPLHAVNEALVNAAAYRNYFDIYNETLVLLLKDSIQIISPGSLINDGRNKVFEEFIPARRNMWLYQRLITLDAKNRFTQTGNGFKRMQQAFSGYGKVKILSIDNKDVFKVVFPGINKFL